MLGEQPCQDAEMEGGGNRCLEGLGELSVSEHRWVPVTRLQVPPEDANVKEMPPKHCS